MSADLCVLRDFVERAFMTFDIPYQYLAGEVLEADIPPTYQPLFGGKKTLHLSFSDVVPPEPGIEQVTHGALVLDALGRMLEGDRNTIGHALIARRIEVGGSLPEYKDRLSVLNAKITGTAATTVYRPTIRIEFRLRSFTRSGIRSQSVPVFYDAERGRILDGPRYAHLKLLDVEELGSGVDTGGLRTPPPATLAAAAQAAAVHLERTLPAMERGPDGEPAEIDARLVRMLVLHDPRPGLHVTFKERSKQKEFTLAFPVGEDSGRITSPFCHHCGRIKTHYYISHRTGKLVCTDCSLLCVGCWDAYSLEGRNCDLCNKRRYCPNCIQECSSCATYVCPDHAEVDKTSGSVYCKGCAPEEIPSASDSGEPTPGERPAIEETAAAVTAGGDDDIFGAGPEPETDDDIFGSVSGETEAHASAAPAAATRAASGAPAETDVSDSEDDIFGGDAPSAVGPAPDDDIFREEFTPSPAPVAETAEAERDDVFVESPPPPPPTTDPDDAAPEASEPEAVDAPASPEDVGPPPEPISPEEAARVLDQPRVGSDSRPTRTRPGKRQVKCACHGVMRDIGALRMDFLSGRYFCPDQLEPCGNCGQATALDFLEGNPPLCFYCSNRMPLNLDPEAEEIFRREVQPVMPIKYRLSSCRVARSPHHLAYYIKPLVGKEVILYWDRWTDTLLDDDQFA